jgi:hypothetical protein
MPTHSMLENRIKRPFAHAIPVVALCMLAVSGARGQTTWTVTVIPTTPNQFNSNLPSYTVTGSNASVTFPNVPSTCNFDRDGANKAWVANQPSGQQQPPPNSGQPNTGDLYVCPGDIVQWTDQSTSTGSEMLILDPDGIILDKNNASPHLFHWPPLGTNPLPGGTIDPSAAGTSHKYTIVVYQPGTGPYHLYAQDPQITIGTGGT